MKLIIFEFSSNTHDIVTLDIELYHRYGKWIEKTKLYAKKNEITSAVMRVTVSEETLSIIKNEKIKSNYAISRSNCNKCCKYINSKIPYGILLILLLSIPI